MPATSADNSILATGRPVRIPTPDDPSGFPNYYRNFRLTTLEGSVGFVDDGTFRPVSGKVPTTLAGSPVNGGIISLNGINDHGVAAGAVSPGPADYANGLVDNNGKFLAFLVSGMTGTRPTGINNNGKIVGYTMTIDGPTHGFIRNASGTITVFDAVAGHATLPTGINNAGLIVGAYGSFRPIASIFVDGPDSSFGNASTGFISSHSQSLAPPRPFRQGSTTSARLWGTTPSP